MSVIFDEVVTEIEQPAGAPASSSSTRPEVEAGQATPGDNELARRITRLQERSQRLAAD